MAGMFAFDRFKPANGYDRGWQFGYWCRKSGQVSRLMSEADIYEHSRLTFPLRHGIRTGT